MMNWKNGALLGLRVLVALEMARLTVGRAVAFGPSVELLAQWEFPAPAFGLGLALAVGAAAVVAFLLGIWTRGAAALAALFFLPVMVFFAASGTDTTWGVWEGLRQGFATLEGVFLFGALLTLLCFGSGAYSLQGERQPVWMREE